MPKYIDANILLENLKKQYGEELGWECTVNMSDIGMMIEDAPAVDSVEVVRCKDCVHYNTNCCAECFGWCEYFNMGMWDEHYCSCGKRKEIRQ